MGIGFYRPVDAIFQLADNLYQFFPVAGVGGVAGAL